MEPASGHRTVYGAVWLWPSQCGLRWKTGRWWMVHQRALERRCRRQVPFCRRRQHRLLLTHWGGFSHCPEGEYGQCSLWCCAGVQCTETLGRARPTYIGVRARTSWSWRAQHLWQQGSKGWWWWMLWDWGSPLGSEALCAAKVKAEQLRTQGGHPQRAQGAPDVTEFRTYQPCTWAELVDLGKSCRQKQGKTLWCGFCISGTQEWAQHLWGFRGSLLREVEGWPCETPFWKCEDPEGGLSWQGSHPGYTDANEGWFLCRHV